MTNEFWTAFFTALPPTAVAIGGVVLGLLNRRNIHIISTQTNGLLSAVEKARLAEGHAAGIEAERSRAESLSTATSSEKELP